MKKRIGLLIYIILLLLQAQAQTLKKSNFKVVGYYSLKAAMNADLKTVPFNKLTHINLSFLNPEGSELAQFTSENGKLTAAVIHEQIQMKPGNFGSRWVKCVTRVGLHFTDGSFSGAVSGLFCMAWGGYCAASIAVLCAGTAYYNIH